VNPERRPCTVGSMPEVPVSALRRRLAALLARAHDWVDGTVPTHWESERQRAVAAQLAETREALVASSQSRAYAQLLARAIFSVTAATDTEHALQGLTELLVPQLTDVAAVWLLDDVFSPAVEGAALELAAKTGAGPVRGARARRVAVTVNPSLPDVPMPPSVTEHLPEGSPLLRAMRSGRSHVVDLTTVDLSNIASGNPAVTWTVGVGGHSAITVPLLSHRQTVGALTMLACGDRPAYVEGDVVHAEELAATAAVAVDRAQSYRRLRDVALTLQRSLLPVGQPELDELEIAARYVAGVEGTEVGGDWYDVVPLGAGRTGLVIGDVMGRGVKAAAVMGQLRSAVRAYARLELPPVELLERLDDLVHDLNPGQIVTAVYGVHDPVSGTLTLANAGHPPPLVVEPAGAVRRLDADTGAPLGLQAASFTEQTVALHTGALLTLYTDGLVERRGRDLDEGIDELTTLLAQHPTAGLPGLADKVLADLGRSGGHDDDVALLLVRVPPAVRDPASRSSQFLLSKHPSMLGAARRHTAAFVEGWLPDLETIHIAVLLVDELLTNALQHGSGQIELRLRRAPHALVIEVCDGSREPPRRRPHDPDAEGGRGLHLVAALSARWGSRPTQNGKAVWCELDVEPDPR
jgi:serine phosphatase RsbU (regulator of sigma subunit)/anti-sigma regulatory factor (Ser/Thr protein kinase)